MGLRNVIRIERKEFVCAMDNLNLLNNMNI